MSSKVLSKSLSRFCLVDIFWLFHSSFATSLRFHFRMAAFCRCNSEASQTSLEMVATVATVGGLVWTFSDVWQRPPEAFISFPMFSWYLRGTEWKHLDLRNIRHAKDSTLSYCYALLCFVDTVSSCQPLHDMRPCKMVVIVNFEKLLWKIQTLKHAKYAKREPKELSLRLQSQVRQIRKHSRSRAKSISATQNRKQSNSIHADWRTKWKESKSFVSESHALAALIGWLGWLRNRNLKAESAAAAMTVHLESLWNENRKAVIQQKPWNRFARAG